MKKTLISCLILAAPWLSFGQGYSNEEKALIATRIDTLLQNYLQKSSLTLPGGNKRNDKVVGDLRAMIKTDAEVFDDINASFNEKTRQYELKSKSRNTFIEDLVDRFPKGLIINNKNVNISYNDLDKNEVHVVVERNVLGTNTDKFTFYNEDTLLLTIGIFPDRSVKIINISKVGSHLRCMNDKDTDGVIDESDDCPESTGVIALNGCPDFDDDGIPDKRDHCPREKGTESNNGCPPSTFAYQFVFSGGIGSLFNRNKLESSMPLNALSKYPDLDENHSNLDVIENPGKRTPSFNYYLNIGYYFGKTSNKTKGISLGVTFTHFEADYQVGGLTYFYRNQQPGSVNKFYHQVDSLSTDAKEHLQFTILNFPLMFRYKSKIGSNLAYEISLGPSLFLLTSSSELNNGRIDFGGIYEFDQSGNYQYTSGGYSFTSDDWIVMRSHLLSQNAQNTVAAGNYADELFNRGYNVGFDQPVNKTADVSSRVSYALNLNLDLFYHIGPQTAVKFGIQYLQSNPKGSGNGYKMVDGRSSRIEYTSVYESSIKSQYTAYGFNFGIIIGLNVKKHRTN